MTLLRRIPALVVSLVLASSVSFAQTPAPAPVQPGPATPAPDAQQPSSPATTPAQTASAPAQSGGTIRGSVKDGAIPLPGVSVTASNSLTGKKYSTTTDITGSYNLVIPQNGRYVLKTDLAAFAPVTKEALLNATSHDRPSTSPSCSPPAPNSRSSRPISPMPRASSSAAAERKVSIFSAPPPISSRPAAAAKKQAQPCRRRFQFRLLVRRIRCRHRANGHHQSLCRHRLRPNARERRDERVAERRSGRPRHGRQGVQTVPAAVVAAEDSAGVVASAVAADAEAAVVAAACAAISATSNPTSPTAPSSGTAATAHSTPKTSPCAARPSSSPPTPRNRFGLTFLSAPYIPKILTNDKNDFLFLTLSGTRNSSPFDQYGTVPTLAERGGDFSAAHHAERHAHHHLRSRELRLHRQRQHARDALHRQCHSLRSVSSRRPPRS